jgi:murein hydrolase activator
MDKLKRFGMLLMSISLFSGPLCSSLFAQRAHTDIELNTHEIEHEHSHVGVSESESSTESVSEVSRLFSIDQEILTITRQQQETRAKLNEFQSKKDRFINEISSLSKSIKGDRMTLVKLLSVREQVKSTRIVELLLSADGPLEQKRREVYIQAVFRSGSKRFKALLKSKRDLLQRQKAVEMLNKKASALKRLLDDQANRLSERRRVEWQEISRLRKGDQTFTGEDAQAHETKNQWENLSRLPPTQGRWIDEYRKFRGLSLAKMYGGGIWILTKKGAPVYSVENGQLLFAREIKGWGKVAIIQHKYGYMSIYANLSELKVKEGQELTMQSPLGSVGFEAGREGLYFELRRRGEPIHPNRWIMNDLSMKNKE